jgi:TonB family protein
LQAKQAITGGLGDKLKSGPLAFAVVASVMLHASAIWIANVVSNEVRRQDAFSHLLYHVELRMAPPQEVSNATTERRTENSALESTAPSLDLESENSQSTETVALGEFLTADQLTVPAEPLGAIILDVPQASQLNAPGTLVLKLWIDQSGKVVRTEIEKSDFSPAYSDAVVQVFSNATYAPAQVGGAPVSSILRIETRYE